MGMNGGDRWKKHKIWSTVQILQSRIQHEPSKIFAGDERQGFNPEQH